jgi:hypothetical protein
MRHFLPALPGFADPQTATWWQLRELEDWNDTGRCELDGVNNDTGELVVLLPGTRWRGGNIAFDQLIRLDWVAFSLVHARLVLSPPPQNPPALPDDALTAAIKKIWRRERMAHRRLSNPDEIAAMFPHDRERARQRAKQLRIELGSPRKGAPRKK